MNAFLDFRETSWVRAWWKVPLGPAPGWPKGDTVRCAI